MAFFGGSSKSSSEQVSSSNSIVKNEVSNEYINTPTNEVSVLKPLVKVKGNIEGGGSLIIDGIIDGDIFIDNCVVIGKDATVSGVIRAKEVKVSGNFEGTIHANVVEITKSGKFNGYINGNKTFLGGEVEGTIKSADSIEITSSGVVLATECKSKKIKIIGKLNGKVIASELLEITSGGAVDGTIITKGIKTEQGGSVVGSIQTYDESIHSGNDKFQEKKEENIPAANLDEEALKKYAKKKDDSK